MEEEEGSVEKALSRVQNPGRSDRRHTSHSGFFLKKSPASPVKAEHEPPLQHTPAAAAHDVELAVATRGAIARNLPVISFPDLKQVMGPAETRLGGGVRQWFPVVLLLSGSNEGRNANTQETHNKLHRLL